MNKLVKIVFRLLLGLLVVSLGIWLFLNYAPQRSTNNKAADFRLKAEKLYTDFQTEEEVSNKKYIGKIVQLKGVIGEKLTDKNQAPVLILRATNSMAGVMCSLLKDQQTAFDGKSIGDEITIKGKCNGLLMDVVLDEGVIVR